MTARASSRRVRFATPSPTVDGLSETLDSVAADEQANGTLETIPLARIVLDPEQPRKLHLSRENPADIPADDPDADRLRAELASLRELADSIMAEGVLEPIGVYRHGHDYRLVFGERRVLASKLAGRETILARLLPERPRHVRAQQLIENVQRSDLTLADRLRGLRAVLMEREAEGHALARADDLARVVGWSVPQAYAYWAILHAHDDVHRAIDAGIVRDVRTARSLAAMGEADRINALARLRMGDVAAGSDDDERDDGDDRSQEEDAQAEASDERVTRIKQKKAAGRPRTSIPLGKTRHPAVARYVCSKLLPPDQFAAYEDADWSDLNVVSEIVKNVMSNLEKEIVATIEKRDRS